MGRRHAGGAWQEMAVHSSSACRGAEWDWVRKRCTGEAGKNVNDIQLYACGWTRQREEGRHAGKVETKKGPAMGFHVAMAETTVVQGQSAAASVEYRWRTW